MNSCVPQIIVSQLGARMHYAVPVLLQRAGMLAHFFTDVYVGRGSSWHALALAAHILPAAWRPPALKRLLSRRVDGLPPEKVTAFNMLGLCYALAQKRAGDLEELERVFLEYGRRFCDLILREPLNRAEAIYAFEVTALPLFHWAGKLGITKILEKFSAPYLIDFSLVSEEHLLWPGWEALYCAAKISQEILAKEQAEWNAADAIICASDFVAAGLSSRGVPAEKLHVVPYGVETNKFATRREPWNGQRPLRLLFIGGVMLRKGVQYLYKALQKLNGRQLSVRMVGSVAIQEPYQSRLRERAELTGRVPRQEVRRHYEWADVFVFPSLCEGSATVTYEALAAGLPVITTPNAGSVVRDGVEGFIVPIRDAEAIASKLDLLAGDPGLLAQMSANAWARAQEFSWEKYGERLIAAINQIMSQA